MHPLIEPLEARIAPALILANPLPDLTAGSGQKTAVVDLSKMFDPNAEHPNRTLVEFTTNLDIDPNTDGVQAGKIVLELFDDEAPLTVQAFLSYVNNQNLRGDYDNTIIHRSFDFGGNSGPGRDIVQGGGFEFPGLKHIPVGPEVHNEFSNSRPNSAGTIALAKTSLSPHTGTSEWFFNVNDNTNLLGENNNGGFTVFGEVISGFDIVQAIAAVGVTNLDNGVFANIPLQNYNADPDSNPLTPKPAPTGDQLIRIVDARTLPNVPGNNAGITYTIEGVFEAGTTTPSGLLTGKITGSKLNLTYVTSKSGFADVVVTANDGDSTVTDTFRVDVRPNLIVNLGADTLQGLIVPGDKGTVAVKLTNNGAANAKGAVSVEVSLVKMQVINGSLEFANPPVTISVGILQSPIGLGGGLSKTLQIPVQIPTTLANEEGVVYQMQAEVTPVFGEIEDAERFSDDNLGRDGERHELQNKFGTIGSLFGFALRTGAVLSYTDTDALGQERLVALSMKGPGQGSLTLDPQGDVQLQTRFTGFTSTLTALLAPGAAHLELGGIEMQDPVGTANLGGFDLEGSLFAVAGLKSLTLGNVAGESLILIGQGPGENLVKSKLKLGQVLDVSLETAMPLASLTAISWLDTEGSGGNTISTPSLGALRITGVPTVQGDFEADVVVSGDLPVASITISGMLRDATIRSSSNIAKVVLGGMERSNLFAGVSERPDEVGDFDANRVIQSFTILGIKNFNGNLFTDSQVAAQTLGTVLVRNVATTSGTGDFGFVSDVLKSYSRVGGVKAVNVQAPRVVEDVDNYLVQVL
jgi:cyclophilin family peptidyl-prolyl cis-trans isomerase